MVPQTSQPTVCTRLNQLNPFLLRLNRSPVDGSRRYRTIARPRTIAGHRLVSRSLSVRHQFSHRHQFTCPPLERQAPSVHGID
ncbi:unnamed protein product [Gadus morhua 'NCC']